MFRKFLLSLLPISALIAIMPVNDLSAQNRVEKRYGWFQNPTPANAWLRDRDGLWLISSQGGYRATGNWPNIPPDQWIVTNVSSYGYDCACLDVRVDRTTNPRRIIEIKSSQAQALQVCRADRYLREPK
jgi:Protein of unknown function (DUF4087)